MCLGEIFNALRRVLLTEWVMWCLKHKGPNQVLPPVHCGAAFCSHDKKEKVKRIVCHMQHSNRGCLENPVFTLESAGNTRHTYISLRCCSLENIVLSSTCNLLWLRSLWRKKGKNYGKSIHHAVYVSAAAVYHLGLHGKHNYIKNLCVIVPDTLNGGNGSQKSHCN